MTAPGPARLSSLLHLPERPHRAPGESPGPRPVHSDRPGGHLRVVPPASRWSAWRRHGTRFLVVAGLTGATVVCFALVYLHVLLAQRQFRIDRLDRKVAQQEQTYQEVRLQVAQLASPARIIAAAEGQLGMVAPSKVTWLAPAGPTPASAFAGGSTLDNGPADAGHGAARLAPLGDAAWPAIKAQLSGAP